MVRGQGGGEAKKILGGSCPCPLTSCAYALARHCDKYKTLLPVILELLLPFLFFL